MKISRAWAMPSKNTFSIKPIRELVIRSMTGKTIDPFANNNDIVGIWKTNDIDENQPTDYHMDALDFLKMFGDGGVDTVLFDPPYSPRQVSECYKRLKKTVNLQTTQSSFWGDMKKEIGRIVSEGGIVITCGWNSGGIGKCNGFEISEILMVPHGGWHNDTIVTVETKLGERQ